jgi:hypothetical protein
MAEPLHLAVSLLQIGIFGLFLVAVRRRNVAAAVNALGAFLLTLLPALIEVAMGTIGSQSVEFGTELPLWLGIAGLLHAVGMLGLYESTWWWDHLTHTLSAALVAAVIYAGLLVSRAGATGAEPVPDTVVVLTVAFTLAIGVCWELIELVAREVGEVFDIEPVLVHYGGRDTALDLVFDGVGAVAVVLLDLRVFEAIFTQFPGVADNLIVASGWFVFGSSAIMGAFVVLAGVVKE